MKLTICHGQDGQALVQVTLMLLVLMLAVALAVDVGHVYGQRRRMQNAADAGALAGARAMCLGYHDQVVLSQAYYYAVDQNGADPDLTDISVSGNRVTVVARKPVDTYFIRVVGISTVDVGAEAEAACGVATSASGLWPIAFSLSVWQDSCGATIYVWDDDKIIDCTEYECDLDGDGDDDIAGGGDRGWLDFSEVVDEGFHDPCVQPGCGANELNCHILNDAGCPVTVPACVPGDSGVKASAWHAAAQRAGTPVRIPLYESIDTCEAGHSCPGGHTYWVTKFGCGTLLDATQIKLKPKAGTGPVVTGKVIEMTIDCDNCATAAGGTDGTPPGPKDMVAVSLTR